MLFNTVFLTEFLLILAILLWFWLNFLQKRRQMAFIAKTLKFLRSKPLPYFYSTAFAKRAALPPLFYSKSTARADRIAALALKKLPTALKRLQKELQTFPKDNRLLLLYAELSLLLNDRPAFTQALSLVRLSFFAPQELKITYERLSAANALYETDMYEASRLASLALARAKRAHYSYEMGLCYLTLTHIYRISGVFDVADTMLRQAEKIFDSLKLHARKAEAMAYFGFIACTRENYDEAIARFEDAANYALRFHLKALYADITNKKGLAAYLKGDMKTAKKAFCTATDIPAASPLALAFSAEMRARLAYKEHHYKTAASLTDVALKNLKQTSDSAAVFELIYLKAEIALADNKPAIARRLLTALIKKKTPASSLWYPANAYTLLGLIELKENNLARARTLFTEAYDLENSRSRIKAAAVDCNNLALVARLSGDKENEQIYLKQALNYATALEDQDLIDYLKKKL